MADGTYQITCKGYLSEVRVQPPEFVAAVTEVVKVLEGGNVQQACFMLGRLSAEAAEMPLAYDVECGYEGEADAWYSGTHRAYTVTWNCPRCGTEGSDDREEGDDDPRL